MTRNHVPHPLSLTSTVTDIRELDLASRPVRDQKILIAVGPRHQPSAVLYSRWLGKDHS